jgi:hypothetical protein
MGFEVTAKKVLYVLAIIGCIMLIVMVGIGMHVVLNPAACNEWSDKLAKIRSAVDPVIYQKTCDDCGECETVGEGDDETTSCANCGSCSAEKETFSVNRIQDIERVQWDQPTNAFVDNHEDPTMNNVHSKWPGHEGFYNSGADGSDTRNIHDTVLNSVISDDVKQNHNAFIANTLTSQPIPGASHMGEKDNYNPPNKWSGLKRDALHKQLGAMGDARQVQSETRAQVADFAYRGNSYLL